jgi:tRNA pseudouridine55 synthase
MNRIILINKPVGKTPLEMLTALRIQNPALQDQKLAYAGRLDPMAEGLMIVLVGEECKNRKTYENLPKMYEFEVLFGLSTDTYDVMGLVQKSNIKPDLTIIEKCIPVFEKKYKGRFLQRYPPYSSIRVDGHPLFYWTREDKLQQIKIPTKKIEVYKLQFISKRVVTSQTVVKEIIARINLVKGEFRQQEIIKRTSEILKNTSVAFPILTFKIECSSGTYVRSIADEMGAIAGFPSLAYSIKRVSIGSYELKDCSS